MEKRQRTRVLSLVLFILLLTSLVFFYWQKTRKLQTKNIFKTQGMSVEIVAQDLDIPWELVFLPDNSLLLTERPGTLLRIFPDSRKQITISGVTHKGEGGLLGLALHPDFEQNHWLYLYLTSNDAGVLSNRVERYDFDLQSNTLTNKRVIIDNIPAAQYHDGGRLAFGPDNLLYITTGDAGQPELAQDQNSLAGKILRFTDNGIEVYSYGHRNPQGLVWDAEGNLWSSEHGPSGLQSGFDEINLIIKGQNYGWPLIKGDQQQDGFISPVLQSGSADTWAPAATEIVGNTIYFVGLRGAALYAADIQNNKLINFRNYFKDEFGRLRIVKLSPDGVKLYIATSNTDGRGRARENDDKLFAIPLSILE